VLVCTIIDAGACVENCEGGFINTYRSSMLDELHSLLATLFDFFNLLPKVAHYPAHKLEQDAIKMSKN
jgi:hypothetical protein